MSHDRYNKNLQPRHSQNGIGNLEHDNLMPYLEQNLKLNSGPKRDKKIQKKRVKDRQRHKMVANVCNTRFEIVKNVLEQMGFTLQEKETIRNSFLIWADSTVNQEKLTELKSFQRLNHFLGMAEISRKDYFARRFAKMQKVRPDDYDFFPKTWLFPQERNVFQMYLKETKLPKIKKYFIVKPSNGAMGCGIKLLSEDDPIKVQESSIVQQYIDRPFLLDGYKNDLRIYVLVTCCDPLRAFIYREGLVRLGTEKYVLPTDLKSESHFIHLTNYSVNKKNRNYAKCQDETKGSKRSLTYLMNLLRSKYNVDIDGLWRKIVAIVVKTLLLVQPNLLHNYKMCRPGQLPISDSVCFEILGFDILLDANLRPWLLEVNRSPSFGIDEMLDRKVKGTLLEDSLRLLNIRPSDKTKYLSLQKQRASRRLTLAAVRSRIDTQLSYECLKKRKSIDKHKQDLIDLLVKTRANASREYFENRNAGKFTRIFPPEDKLLQAEYLSILTDSFILFNQLNTNSTSNTASNATSTSNKADNNAASHGGTDAASVANQQAQLCFQMNYEREEILVEKIKECEHQENEILMKFNIPANSVQTSLIPIVDFYESSSEETSSSESDSDSSSSSLSSNVHKRESHIPSTFSTVNGLMTSTKSDGDFNSRQNQSTYPSSNSPNNSNSNKPKTSERSKSSDSQKDSRTSQKPNSKVEHSNKSSRTSSCSKSKKNKSRSRSSSSSSSSSSESDKEKEKNKKSIKTVEGEDKESVVENFIESRSKIVLPGPEIYTELLKIILTGLSKLTIKYPGQEDNATKVLLQKIQSNWDMYKKEVSNYWLINLNSKKREKVLQIVKTNVDSVIGEQMDFSSDLFKTKLSRLLDKLFNRLLWNRGHGLMQCFTNSRSWKLIFCGTNENTLRPLELEICGRVVQLCLDCVIIVYHFSLNLANSTDSASVTSNRTRHSLTDSLPSYATRNSLFYKFSQLTKASRVSNSNTNIYGNPSNKSVAQMNQDYNSNRLSLATRSSISIVPYQ